MMIKVSSEYLDFNADIEVERQAKVFEELDKTAGDFSYEFELELTSENIRILQCPFPDNISKNVYHKVNAQLTGNDGVMIYDGFLRIQRIVGRIAFCSFFSGNNNWFGQLSGPMSDVDFSDLETEQTEANIVASWSLDSGLVFPLVDNNVLIQRQSARLKIEDFVPATYVHTIVKRIFQKHSIKINGELFSDPNYKKLVISSSPSDNIQSRSSYVGKTAAQAITFPPVLLTFDDDSNFPFFDGSQDNYKLASSEYLADVKMRITVDVTATFTAIGVGAIAKLYIVKNGSEIKHIGFVSTGPDKTISMSMEVLLEAGDNITISAECNLGGCSIEDATARFTPSYLYVAFGDSVIPDWTQQEFVSNIFRLFNVISSYDPVTKTLTANLFERIKSKTPIDISEYISATETDYIDFISNYGKKSLATYETIEFDDWFPNGIKTFFASGDGFIQVDNDFIEDTADLIESDFTAPNTYINATFDMSMERLSTLELDSIDNTNATSVTDSSGMARFNGVDDVFVVGDLVRISDSLVSGYNGDWIVENVGAGWVEFYDLSFDDDATASLSTMKHVYTGDEDVYLFFNVPNYDVIKFSGASSFILETTDRSSMAVGYFNLMDTGRQINTDFIQTLSFGEVESDLFYQRTMLQTYWNLSGNTLNDPVKEIATVNLPYSTFNDIDFLSPMFVKTLDSSNLYFPSKITGYKGKEFDAVIELIKLP